MALQPRIWKINGVDHNLASPLDLLIAEQFRGPLQFMVLWKRLLSNKSCHKFSSLRFKVRLSVQTNKEINCQ